MQWDSTQAQTAFYLLTEYGHWPYDRPFFDLPPALGTELLGYLRGNVSWSVSLLKDIKDELRQLRVSLTAGD